MHMKFFVDTADTAEIKSLASSGLLDGMTTNPSLVARTGKKFTDVIREICAIVPRAISAEVAATDYDVSRHPMQAAKPGAHVATLPPRSLFNHPLTDKGLAAFLADRGNTGQTIA
jgi:transaldolase